MHGVSDAAKLVSTSPLPVLDDVAFDVFDRLGASDNRAFGAQYPCPHAPLPTLQPRPRGRRCTARGETWLATPFVSRDSHPLPFHQLAWHSEYARFCVIANMAAIACPIVSAAFSISRSPRCA